MNAEATGAIADDAAAKIDDREIDEGIVETSNVIAPTQSTMANTTDVAFHSPATEIIATPFTTDSRFEYPFPNTNSSSPSIILNSSFPPVSSPVPIPATPNTHNLSGLSSAPASITSFSPIFSFPANLPTYSLTHPKIRATPPPVPPSLAKKRQRWSVTLPLLRRRSSQPTEGTHPHVVVEGREPRSMSIDLTRPEEPQSALPKM
ncbi:hypothetical protein C0991_009064 [Blastosporella zonata]|nr:hypothetical protein C0991_009064 [Blastosporella zonata]